MPFAAGGITFTGTMGDVSAYRMRGVDRIVIRSKGGVSRQRIKSHPNYELTRRNNEEWKACIMAGKSIRAAIYAIKHLSDHNFSGSLHGICKSIQLQDELNEKGKRSVALSQGQYRLEGFGLNRTNSFESMMRHPLQFAVDRTAATAVVSLPDMLPGINLYNPYRQPLYRFILMLGVVTDIVYDESRKLYQPLAAVMPGPAIVRTVWAAVNEERPAQEITLAINGWQDVAGAGLLLSAGIEFGMPAANNMAQPVKYAGAARLLKMQ